MLVKEFEDIEIVSAVKSVTRKYTFFNLGGSTRNGLNDTCCEQLGVSFLATTCTQVVTYFNLSSVLSHATWATEIATRLMNLANKRQLYSMFCICELQCYSA